MLPLRPPVFVAHFLIGVFVLYDYGDPAALVYMVHVFTIIYFVYNFSSNLKDKYKLT